VCVCGCGGSTAAVNSASSHLWLRTGDSLVARPARLSTMPCGAAAAARVRRRTSVAARCFLLGGLALEGTEVQCRQALSGSDYGLLSEETLQPTPDYWASLLWRRLMGGTAFAVALPPTAPRSLRALPPLGTRLQSPETTRDCARACRRVLPLRPRRAVRAAPPRLSAPQLGGRAPLSPPLRRRARRRRRRRRRRQRRRRRRLCRRGQRRRRSSRRPLRGPRDVAARCGVGGGDHSQRQRRGGGGGIGRYAAQLLRRRGRRGRGRRGASGGGAVCGLRGARGLTLAPSLREGRKGGRERV